MLDLLLQDRELIQNFQTSEREPFAMIFCSKFYPSNFYAQARYHYSPLFSYQVVTYVFF